MTWYLDGKPLRPRRLPLAMQHLGTPPYLVHGGAIFEVIGHLFYEGTDVWTPTVFRAICSRNGILGVAEIRCVVYATLDVVALISYTDREVAVRETTELTNLPTSPSILEIQHRRTSGSQVRTHSVEFE